MEHRAADSSKAVAAIGEPKQQLMNYVVKKAADNKIWYPDSIRPSMIYFSSFACSQATEWIRHKTSLLALLYMRSRSRLDLVCGSPMAHLKKQIIAFTYIQVTLMPEGSCRF